uniref:ATP synthase F0 subunit 6 n=1 Tax=Dinobdella ferox TaxID=755736 RepID=UPI0023D8ACBA|nr:ATP synthase F0 subunit 6 [Dinobdella ferox]WDA96091.1 ATP synthase F0 subunit 6 [Dinobdella ferox]
MLMDVFSIFDIYEFTYYSCMKTMIMFFPLLLIYPMMKSLWMKNKFTKFIISSMIKTMFYQSMRTKSTNMKGYSIMLSMLFVVLIICNMMGMLAFSLSISSHLVFTLSIGVPLWTSLIMSSALFNPKQFTAHFLPDGAPDWLNPFLILIETISVAVRPITLSFRLAANMTAGHVVLCLMNQYLSFVMNKMTLNNFLLTSLSSFYIFFELFICLIQAYIFCLLLTLYSDDHSH